MVDVEISYSSRACEFFGESCFWENEDKPQGETDDGKEGDDQKNVAAAYMNTDYGHIFLVIALLSIIGFTLWFVLIFPKTRFAKKLASPTAVGDLNIDHSSLLERQGEAYTDLRPSGKANIDDKRFDVVTEGVFLEKGDPVRVVAVEGQRIVVRKI